MASQQAAIRETILGMTHRLAREREGPHNSDSEEPHATNRGNKLKRRAEFYHEDELGGRIPYRRKIEHAGYSRYILKHNPRRYDEEGFELESEDEDSEADREAEDNNPYSGIQIEKTLGPLTHIKNLQHHTAMSHPYKSAALPNMITETMDMCHRERKILVDVKLLMEPLRGDQKWLPVGSLVREDDAMLFGTELQSPHLFVQPDPRPFRENSVIEIGLNEVGANATANAAAVNGEKETDTNKPSSESQVDGEADQPTVHGSTADTVAVKDAEMVDAAVEEPAQQDTKPTDEARTSTTKPDPDAEPSDLPTTTTTDTPAEPSDAQATTDDRHNISKSSNPPTPSIISSPTTSPPPRMRTRGRAAAENTPNPNASNSQEGSPSKDSGGNPRSPSPPPLHPLYAMPASVLPDRDIGLPPSEAEDLRRLLSLYTQKQEEVCRSAERLYGNLLKSRRLRDTVWWWARAEEHKGELSDGEDWVDEEEWGLDGPLRKGNETGVDDSGVVEEAANAAVREATAVAVAAALNGAGKKTRRGRVAA